MERLTHERNNGIKTGYWSPNKKEELVQRLAAYENTGVTPEEIRSNAPDIYVGDWIPADNPPEPQKIVIVSVHCSEWISDYDSDFVPKEEKKYHPDECFTATGYINKQGCWKFFDECGSSVDCVKEFGNNKGDIYDVVTAWMPLPEPYKGE